MTIGDRIKAKRLALDLTLEDVSKVVGITRQTVQKYESGVVSNIPSDKIELLAKALKTTPSYLMGWTLDAQLDDTQERILELSNELNETHDPERRSEIHNTLDILFESVRDISFAIELQESLKPTPVSESGPADPLEQQLIELVSRLTPDQKKLFLAQLKMLEESQ